MWCNFLYSCLVSLFSSALPKTFVIKARKQLCATTKCVPNDGCRQKKIHFLCSHSPILVRSLRFCYLYDSYTLIGRSLSP